MFSIVFPRLKLSPTPSLLSTAAIATVFHPWALPPMPSRTALVTNQPIPLRRRQKIPAVWMRAGTSKGLFLHRRDLPKSIEDWQPAILQAMGSGDADPRQLDGIGGATSTTSKVAVVAKSHRPDADVDYTFIQVSLGNAKLGMTGNCGNIASGVGPFAIDEGLVSAKLGSNKVTVRVFNTNTKTLMLETFAIDEQGYFLEDGGCSLPGLKCTGSPVEIDFVCPEGSMTGKLLPTGHAAECIIIDNTPITISAVDAANPFVFVDAETLPRYIFDLGVESTESLAFIERIRRRAAVLMGLAHDEEAAAETRGTPKIAIISRLEEEGVDVEVIAFSMGKKHSSLQLTGAVTIASAMCTEGTIVQECSSRDHTQLEKTRTVVIRHSGGLMTVQAQLDERAEVESVRVTRTARRLMEGKVCYLL